MKIEDYARRRPSRGTVKTLAFETCSHLSSAINYIDLLISKCKDLSEAQVKALNRLCVDIREIREEFKDTVKGELWE